MHGEVESAVLKKTVKGGWRGDGTDIWNNMCDRPRNLAGRHCSALNVIRRVEAMEI
jgi:hypothetical protein